VRAFASATCVSVAGAPGASAPASDDDARIAADGGAQPAIALCFERCELGAPASGYWMPLCDCPKDCPDPKSVCDPFADDTLEPAFGALVTCTALDAALHEPLTCL
jgi:hypothetical protein